MVSPELLRRYPFFSFLDNSKLKEVAMISEELTCESGDTLIASGMRAESLYLLMDGSLYLTFTVVDNSVRNHHKEFYIGDINPGEIAGISAVIEPFRYTMTVRATNTSRVIKLCGSALLAICEADPQLAYGLMRQVAKAAIERLDSTRVQLAAERA